MLGHLLLHILAILAVHLVGEEVALSDLLPADRLVWLLVRKLLQMLQHILGTFHVGIIIHDL